MNAFIHFCRRIICIKLTHSGPTDVHRPIEHPFLTVGELNRVKLNLSAQSEANRKDGGLSFVFSIKGVVVDLVNNAIVDILSEPSGALGWLTCSSADAGVRNVCVSCAEESHLPPHIPHPFPLTTHLG